MIGRSDLMELCQTLSLVMLTLACFQKSCRHFTAGEGVFPKSVPETSYGNTQEKFGSYALGCFRVACSKVEQWSVQCTCEITFAGVNLVGVFI